VFHVIELDFTKRKIVNQNYVYLFLMSYL